MKCFLAAVPIGEADHRVETVADPCDCLAAGGVVSPIFGAFDPVCPPAPADGAILLLFPRSPRKLLALALAQLDPAETGQFFISHGLASVGVMLQDPARHRELLDVFGDLLYGYELWPINERRVTPDSITHQILIEAEPTELAKISDSDLPFDAAAQVRQFSANIAMVEPKVAVYAPEYGALLSWLRTSVTQVADEIRSLSPNSASDVQLRNDATATLVELNAGLTMLASQLLSGTRPLLRHDYPVAEYSLLGIGGMCRGTWSLYAHLSERLSQANHLGRLTQAFDVGEPFPIYMNRQALDFAAWETSKLRLELLPTSNAVRPRLHVLYFSSRYGFHETLNTMSASWQCVHSSASRDWNLLTLSHEFLHAHVREILACVFDRFSYAELATIIERDSPTTPWESAAGALVTAMLHCDRVRHDLSYITKDNPTHLSPGWRSDPNATEIAALVEGQMRRYLQEMLVHALDYLYVYDSRDDLYAQSIWGSWTFVPAVLKRVRHYVVRTLVALSSRSAQAIPVLDAFNDALARFRVVLEEMVAQAPNAVLSAALNLVKDEDELARVNVEFDQAYYLARFARTFLFDPRTAQALQQDENVAVVGGVQTYGLDVGAFPDFDIQSPTEFLRDRFASYSFTATEESRSYESLWQVMLLVDAVRPSWKP